MANVYFIADTHFFHENVIKYENRPFANAEEMNEQLIKNWNNRVSKEDKVFMLGDFALANKSKIGEVLARLNGYKVLVMGNHDHYKSRVYLELGFNEVSRYPIIYDGFWILSHEPLYVNVNMPYANIFGHVHSNPAYSDYTSRTICVSVERKHMGYAPISFSEIKKLMGVEETKEEQGIAE